MAETSVRLFSTRDIVWVETPQALATSFIVTLDRMETAMKTLNKKIKVYYASFLRFK
jgi:hypothetical protein